jgi:hypothetical protein
MKNAIRVLFPHTFDRFCRWHMLKKYKDHLNQLYDQHSKLNDKLISVINHPLIPQQFEAEWPAMCDEFNLHDRVMMRALYKLQCSVIFHYSVIPLATMLSHSSLLQCSIIFTGMVLSYFSCYNAQSLIVATIPSHFPLQKVFNHSLVLQCSVIFCCYSAHTFLIPTVCGAAQSFYKMTKWGARGCSVILRRRGHVGRLAAQSGWHTGARWLVARLREHTT